MVDDVPSARFPIYCRGNTGEVFPNIVTPLIAEGTLLEVDGGRGSVLVLGR